MQKRYGIFEKSILCTKKFYNAQFVFILAKFRYFFDQNVWPFGHFEFRGQPSPFPFFAEMCIFGLLSRGHYLKYSKKQIVPPFLSFPVNMDPKFRFL